MASTRRPSKLVVREALDCYVFIGPALLGFLIFTLVPIIVSFYYALSDYSLIATAHFVGLENYITIFQDPLFWQSLKVSATYALISVPVGMACGLLLAILLNQKVRGVTAFRTLVYVPSVLSGVAIALLWAWIFNPNFGIINVLLGRIGIKGPQWIFSREWALPSLIIMSLWGIGGGILINLAGLQGIPTELYEAAEIDGASWYHKFFRVTIPMLSPVIFFNLVMGIIGSLQTFTQSYVMTKGGPGNATLFYVLYLFRNAFEYFKMGYASALAWVLLFIILILTMLVFRSAPFWVYYEGERKRA
ncbi:MAG: carbohydrate ABC transporter permease [Anaerolineae bacterium]